MPVLHGKTTFMNPLLKPYIQSLVEMVTPFIRSVLIPLLAVPILKFTGNGSFKVSYPEQW